MMILKAIIFLILPLSIFASDIDYVEWVNYNQKKNLVSTNNCIIDNLGYVWVATEDGIFYYDGDVLQKYYSYKYKEINVSRISKLSKSSDGRVFFFTYPSYKLYSIYNKNIQEVKNDKAYLINASFSKKLIKIDKSVLNKFLNVYPKPYDPLIYKNHNNLSFSLYFEKELNKYISTNNAFFVFDNSYNIKKIFNYNYYLEKFFFKINDKIYVFTGNSISLFTDDFRLKPLTLDDPILIKFFKNIDVFIDYYKFLKLDSNGWLYLLLDGKAYKINESNGKLFTTYLFKTENYQLSSIEYDEKNKIFFVTSPTKGFGYVRTKNVKTISNRVKSNSVVNNVVQINDKYYSTSGWVYSTKTQKVNYLEGHLKQNNPYFILNFKKKFYVSIDSFLININNKYDKIKIGNKDTDNHLLAYYFHNDKLWFSKCHEKGGLYYRFNNQIIKDTFISQKLGNKIISSICSYKNEILLGTYSGLFRYNSKTKLIKKIHDLKDCYIRTIIKNGDDTYWICTYNDGVYFFQNNKAYKVIIKNFVTNAIHCVVEARNQLWMSSNDGIYNIDNKNLINKIKKGDTLSFYKFSSFDGFPTNEFNGGCTHPFLFDKKNNILGFPSMEGFAYFKVDKIKKYIFDYQISIDTIEADTGTKSFVNNTHFFSKEANLVKVKIQYPYYGNRDNLIVSYNINEGKWYKIRNNEFIIYRSKNEINVKIKINTLGADKYVTKKIKLYFEPRLHETYWFWIVISILSLTFLYLSFKLGRVVNRKREQILQDQVNKKTKELRESLTNLEASKNEIAKSLLQKEILLKEIHHRVKNNLQLVISLLNIQSRRNNFTSLDEFLEKGHTRIMSMVLIHESLYQNDTVEKLDVHLYLETFAQNILNSFNEKGRIAIVPEVNNVTLDLQTAITFGLIVNEFVTNSIKYAFPNNQKGVITISLSKINDIDFELLMCDNGVGFDSNIKNNNSFGIQLIKLLVNQLNGSVEISSSKGTVYKIIFAENFNI